MEIDLDMAALLTVFSAEAEETLGDMEEALLTLEKDPDSREAIDELFRLVHTLKGDAGSLGLEAPAGFAHRLEDLLELVRRGDLRMRSRLVTLLLRSIDVLRSLLADSRAGGETGGSGPGELITALEAEVRSQQEAAAPGGAESAAGGSPSAPGTLSAELSWHGRTLRVDLEKLDELLRLTGEIAVARGRLSRLLEEPGSDHSGVLEEHREAERLHLDLQELVMKLRMVPVASVFRQYRRTVRDLAESHGKQARLVVEGGEVEVDNSVLQLLRDPLNHLIRNALDHGIETPAERLARGKEACGEVRLRARHEAGSVVIELADDGAGIDRESILKRARAIGRVSAEESPPDAELLRLLFEPGFSTVESVTDLSGRGVGMDVVQKNIEELRGSVSIASRRGEGTRVTVRLPLTLAIIDGLQVRVERETFIVPLDPVTESLELPAGARAGAGGRGVASVRGRNIPYLRLRDLFSVGGPPPGRENLIVLRVAGTEAGLVVDEVEAKCQTVIKPLTRALQSLRCFTGSAILGDGRVALILSAHDLLLGEIEGIAVPGGSAGALRLGPGGPAGEGNLAVNVS